MSLVQVRNTTESQFHINVLLDSNEVTEAIVLPGTREGEGPIVPKITEIDAQVLEAARKQKNGVVDGYFEAGYLSLVSAPKAEAKKAV